MSSQLVTMTVIQKLKVSSYNGALCTSEIDQLKNMTNVSTEYVGCSSCLCAKARWNNSGAYKDLNIFGFGFLL